MHMIFQPTIALLNRLKYPQKFVLISFFFLLPLAYVQYQYLIEVDGSIEIAQKEMVGDAYLRPLYRVLHDLPQTEDADLFPQRKPHGAKNPAERVDALLDADLSVLSHIDNQLGATLDVAGRFDSLHSQWKALKLRKSVPTTKDRHTAYRQLFDDTEALISRVGDTSTLILDPDLDSYYTMNAVVVDIATGEDLLAQAEELEQSIRKQNALSPEEQAGYIALSGLLASNNRAIEHDFEVAFGNNPLANLKPHLHHSLARALAVRSQLLDGLRDRIHLPSRAVKVNTTNVARIHACMEANAALWNQGIDALDVLLRHRITGFENHKLRAEALTATMLVLVIYLYIGFYLAVMRTVSTLDAAALRMTDGDWTDAAGVALDSRDELANVALSFNRIAAQLRSEWAQAQEEKGRAAAAEHKYRTIFENSIEGIFQTTPEGRYLSANPALARMYGYESPEHLMSEITRIDRQLYVEADRREQFATLIAHQGQVTRMESRIYRRDGNVIWISESAHAIRDSQGTLLYYEGAVEDITERKRAEEALRSQEEQYRLLFESNPLPMYVYDPANFTFLAVNTAAIRHYGYSYDEFLTMTLADILLPEDIPAMKQTVEAIASTDQPGSGLWRHRKKDGTVIDVEITSGLLYFGGTPARVVLANDVTERRKADEMVRWQAYHDAMTGLPNRLLFQDRVEQAIAAGKRMGTNAAVLFLDLDGFKHINDTLGHSTGDSLLKVVATRLWGCLREEDTIARMGGDEFTILLPHLATPEDASHVAQRLLESLTTPIVLDQNELFVTASIGISLFPIDGEDTQTLLRHADVAMYRAKEQGRNGYQLYKEAMNVAAFERLMLENNLRKAIEREEFILHYQPQVHLGTGVVVGVEALVRWSHPELGLVPPGKFIPIAEEMGMILPLGELVLRTACRQAALWNAGGRPLRVAVNLSGRQVGQRGLVEIVTSILEETGLNPRLLDLELTESALIQNGEAAVLNLRRLRALGVRLSVDDFGTGYSSLSYLRRFPLDTLKIDRSFVQDMEKDIEGQAIARAIIDLSHALSLEVVAEGVETPEQRQCLMEMGCDIMQGYLFSPPVTVEHLEAILGMPPTLSPSYPPAPFPQG